MNSVHSLAASIAIFVTLFVQSSFASSIEQCVQEVCKASTGGGSISTFLNLEKTEHPELDTFYGKYREKIERVRGIREQKVRAAIGFFSNKENVSDSIKSLSDTNLMNLYIEHEPWNLETDFSQGKYIVVADPLINGFPKKEKVIKDIFGRLKLASVLYSAELSVNQLNTSPHEALGLDENQSIETYVLNMLTTAIEQLPEDSRQELNLKLEKYRSRLDALKNVFGEKVYVSLGSIHLEVQILLGRVPFVSDERKIIEDLLVGRISTIVEQKAEEIAILDETFSSSHWESTCRKAYNRSLHYGLSETEKDRIENQMKPEALRRSQEALTSIFGTEMTGRIMEFVNSMNIGGPMSMSQYVDFIEKRMDYYLTDELEADETSKLLDNYNLINSLSKNKDDAMVTICNSWIFEPLRDSVSGNSVILSSYSAKHYHVGLSISIHEMGHAASVGLDLLKRRGVDIDPFEEIRSCISENYNDYDRAPIYEHSRFEGDKLWTEEDWADSFAGYAMRGLNVIDNCGFLGAMPERDFATMSQRSSDTHSPTFYRILNINAHLGKEQPKQCERPLETDYQGTTFKDCISKHSKGGTK